MFSTVSPFVHLPSFEVYLPEYVCVCVCVCVRVCARMCYFICYLVIDTFSGCCSLLRWFLVPTASITCSITILTFLMTAVHEV